MEVEILKISDSETRASLGDSLHWLHADSKSFPYEVKAIIKRLFSFTDEQYFSRMYEENAAKKADPPVSDGHVSVFSDASPYAWGVVELSARRISCFSAPFRVGPKGGLPPFDTKPSIEYYELMGMLHGVVHSLATCDSLKSITAFVDNKEIVRRVTYWQNKERWDEMPDTDEKGMLEAQAEILKEKNSPAVVEKVMDNIILQLLARVRKSNAKLRICWVPGYMNVADAPSRGYIRSFQHSLDETQTSSASQEGQLSDGANEIGKTPPAKPKKENLKSARKERKKREKLILAETPRKPFAMDLDAKRTDEIGEDMFSDFYKEAF